MASRGLIGLGLASSAVIGASVASCSGVENAHPAVQNWNHRGHLDTYDAASLRRGYEVYRQVCSTCHSMNYMFFRSLVGFTHTKVQAKALAESYEIQDGFQDDGEPAFRKGRLADILPAPYPNIETARYANGGAEPPDLSLIIKARGEGEDSYAGVSHDYVFALLTGFGHDAPPGIKVMPGQYYNPWFPGNVISMAPPLQHEAMDYEDGTISTESQMAKDVSAFLCFASEPYHDERKRIGLASVGMFAIGSLAAGWRKRFRWGPIKNTRISYIN